MRAPSRSSQEANRCTAQRSLYTMGCRSTTFLPHSRSSRASFRAVWLLLLPVRTAPTASTGPRTRSRVSCGPSRRALVPAARAREATCITCSCDTSL
ncbi:MAG: hypothetical protein C4304_07205 [candidate division GAL15 bacterium]